MGKCNWMMLVLGGCGIARSGVAAEPVQYSNTIALPPTSAQTTGTGRGPLSAEQRERAVLLALHLRELIQRESTPLWMPISLSVIGTLGVVGASAAIKDDAGFGVPILVGFGAMTVTTTASLFYSEDAQRNAVLSTPLLPLAGLMMGATLAVDDDRAPKLSLASAGLGELGTSILCAISAYGTHGVPIQRLREHNSRLSSPEGRASLTTAELIQMESDFRSREPIIPLWLAFSPLAVSGLVAAVPAVDGSRSSTARAIAAGLGASQFLRFAVAATVTHPATAYRQDLGKLQLSVAALGNGIALVGSF